jgi:CubicO group peptidase (beta-lactamase class C family)
MALVHGRDLNRREFGGLMMGGLALRPSRKTADWYVTGHGGPGGFDAVIQGFMRARGIPCGSLAITCGGRLVMARGYTWNTASRTQPTSLFRVASVSKPVTATAVLRLVQDGRLTLEDRPARILRLSTAADRRLDDVTVLHLLRHTGGWDRKISGDPMFDDAAIADALGKRLPIGRRDIIAYVTARALDHAPGTRYAYSNYGYLLLGKIIERVTGRPYAEHIRQAVLGPLRIQRMRLGRTLLRTNGEVPYSSRFDGPTVMDPSGRTVPGPYGTFNQENNAFNCGWLASAVDLARFATVYDGTTTVLTRKTVDAALARPGTKPSGGYYACGWHVRPMAWGRDTWHTGSLPGAYALVLRRFDGVTLAALFDRRDDPAGEGHAEIEEELQEAADAVDGWPSVDLGPGYF